MTERDELPQNLPIEQLLALAEDLRLEPADLDDAVHDLAQEVGLAELNSLEHDVDQEEHIMTQEVRASDINNGGLEAQVAFLLEHHGHEGTRRLLGLRLGQRHVLRPAHQHGRKPHRPVPAQRRKQDRGQD